MANALTVNQSLDEQQDCVAFTLPANIAKTGKDNLHPSTYSQSVKLTRSIVLFPIRDLSSSAAWANPKKTLVIESKRATVARLRDLEFDETIPNCKI